MDDLKPILRDHLPEAIDFLRDLYNAGMIPGARAVRSVTVADRRYGADPLGGVEVSIKPIIEAYRAGLVLEAQRQKEDAKKRAKAKKKEAA